ncbi:MAG: 50S ribosomal protein L25 [Candidatus Jorgensenbacteria bacterium]|nr:50S ribosomal protein L25 [Candidatus Jorgensenbacteria bacterium]
MELHLSPRTVLGKKVKRIRAEGIVPGELYGHGTSNRHVSVNNKEFLKVYRASGENTIVTADIEGNGKAPVLISHVDRDAISGAILSIDFHQIRMDEKITTQVPIAFHGESPATKAGLVVIKVLHEINIESLPGNIPHEFRVSLEKLEKTGDSIAVQDIPVPNGVKILTSADMTVVTVQEKTREEVQAPAAVPIATETTTAETKAETAPTAKASEQKTEKK